MVVEILVEVLRNSILITGLVLIMMLLIEYFNIQSHGKWFSKLRDKKIRQVLLGSLLGLIPGCMGGFAAVSLYTHRLISFGALVAMMICSSGDEAFVILALIPRQGVILFALLFIIAVITGIITDRLFFKKNEVSLCPDTYEIHNHEECSFPPLFKAGSYRAALTHPSKERILILAGVALFIIAVISGVLEHDHTDMESGEHLHAHFNILDERWINMIFAIFSIITLFFTATVSEHFVKEHLWNHVIKKHLLPIFLWTFGALFICQAGIRYLDIESWINNNMLWVIALAVLIGIIPESGPHLVFVTLFAQGIIPFYVLLVNSIVQDGHTTLPLLAESKKAFFAAKAINAFVGAVTGMVFYIFFS